MRHVVVASFVQLCLIGVVAACGYPPLDKVPGPPQEVKDLPVTASRDLDLLFLVDDSPSMLDKQNNLANNFPRFIEALSTLQGGLPNVHIGVATSDMGTKGADDAVPGPTIGTIGQGGCAGTGKDGALQLFGAAGSVSGGPFISDIADPVSGTRVRNYTGNLTDVFAGMAKAGSAGCGFEQHLAAVERALGNPVNQGFLRPDAYLGVILIADEDDCSLSHSSLLGPDTDTLGPLQSFRCTRFGITCDDGGQTPDVMNMVGTKASCHPSDSSPYLTAVQDHATFLKALKPDPSKVIVAAISGPTEPVAVELRVPPRQTVAIPSLAHSCMYTGGDGMLEVADPPIRIKAFLDQFPERSAFEPICQQDLSGGLQQVAALFKTALGDPCIEGTLADTDPKAPGPQYDCSVSVVINQGQVNQTEQSLALCTPEDATATNQPCWHLVTDPTSCPNSDHVKLVVESLDTLPKDGHVIASCTIVATP